MSDARGGHEPRPVRDSLEVLARRLGAPRASSLSTVFGHWADLVGETIAANTRPVALVDGVLTVAVAHPGWATEVRYLGPRLVARINEIAGPDTVGRIEVRVRPLGGS